MRRSRSINSSRSGQQGNAHDRRLGSAGDLQHQLEGQDAARASPARMYDGPRLSPAAPAGSRWRRFSIRHSTRLTASPITPAPAPPIWRLNGVVILDNNSQPAKASRLISALVFCSAGQIERLLAGAPSTDDHLVADSRDQHLGRTGLPGDSHQVDSELTRPALAPRRMAGRRFEVRTAERSWPLFRRGSLGACRLQDAAQIIDAGTLASARRKFRPPTIPSTLPLSPLAGAAKAVRTGNGIVTR